MAQQTYRAHQVDSSWWSRLHFHRLQGRCRRTCSLSPPCRSLRGWTASPASCGDPECLRNTNNDVCCFHFPSLIQSFTTLSQLLKNSFGTVCFHEQQVPCLIQTDSFNFRMQQYLKIFKITFFLYLRFLPKAIAIQEKQNIPRLKHQPLTWLVFHVFHIGRILWHLLTSISTALCRDGTFPNCSYPQCVEEMVQPFLMPFLSCAISVLLWFTLSACVCNLPSHPLHTVFGMIWVSDWG